MLDRFFRIAIAVCVYGALLHFGGLLLVAIIAGFVIAVLMGAFDG